MDKNNIEFEDLGEKELANILLGEVKAKAVHEYIAKAVIFVSKELRLLKETSHIKTEEDPNLDQHVGKYKAYIKVLDFLKESLQNKKNG